MNMDNYRDFLLSVSAEDFIECLAIYNDVSSLRAAQAKRTFKVGDPISFEYKGETKYGTITKFMKKNVKIMTDGGKIWNVFPGYLKLETRQKKLEVI